MSLSKYNGHSGCIIDWRPDAAHRLRNGQLPAIRIAGSGLGVDRFGAALGIKQAGCLIGQFPLPQTHLRRMNPKLLADLIYCFATTNRLKSYFGLDLSGKTFAFCLTYTLKADSLCATNPDILFIPTCL